MRKYEIPYNWDKKSVIELLKIVGHDQIECIYVPAYFEHCYSTRTELNNYPKTLSEYIDHINFLSITLGLKVLILFQYENGHTYDSLDFYLSLGIDHFTVRNDDIAKELKSKNKNLIIVGSITKGLSFSDYFNKNLSMYDRIVLDFRFNKRIDLIKQLPKKYKYEIMLNCSCPLNTNPLLCQNHWKGDVAHKCNSNFDGPNAFIKPTDIYKYDDYIDVYKIQGREAIELIQYVSIAEFFIK